MNRESVEKEIRQCTEPELIAWRQHAQRCLVYFSKARNDFEVEECEFIISHIDRRLAQLKDR